MGSSLSAAGVGAPNIMRDAYTMARRYRFCPGREQESDFHYYSCEYCSAGSEQEAWYASCAELDRALAAAALQRPVVPRPGDLYLAFDRSAQGQGPEDRSSEILLRPPLVLILELESGTGLAIAAQIFHEYLLAGRGDLVISIPQLDMPAAFYCDAYLTRPFFVECWNTYPLPVAMLGGYLGQLPPTVLEAVRSIRSALESGPEPANGIRYPFWAASPAPLAGRGDIRQAFRDSEKEAAYCIAEKGGSFLRRHNPLPELDEELADEEVSGDLSVIQAHDVLV
jgi:hypothetical protein